MTKSGITRLRFLALSLLIAVSHTAPAFAEQTNGTAVSPKVATPNAGAATQAAPTANPTAAPAGAAKGVSSTAPPKAPAPAATAPVAAASSATPAAPAADTIAPVASVKPSPAALTNDGIRAIADGRYADAIKVLEQAIALDANSVAARSNLAMAYNDLALQQAKTDQLLAMSTLRKSLTLNPKQTLARQNFDSMIRHFGRDPASFDDRVELGHLARQNKDIAGVIYEYKAALAIQKDSNVEDLLKEALAPPKVYPVRPPRPAVTVQPNVNSPKPGAPNAAPNTAPGASAPVPAPGSVSAPAPVAPAQAPAAVPAQAPAAVPAAVPTVPAKAPANAAPAAVPSSTTPPVTPDGANSSTRPNPNPN